VIDLVRHLSLVVCGSVLCAAAGQAEESSARSPEARAHAALEELGDGVPEEEVSANLVAIGPGACAPLVGMLGDFPSELAPARNGRRAIVEALESMPSSAVLPSLRAAASDPEDIDSAGRTSWIDAFAVHGTLGDLDLVLDLTDELAADSRLHRSLANYITAIATRDGRTPDRVARRLFQVESVHSAPLIQGLAMTGDPRALTTLASLLHDHPELDAVLLLQLGNGAEVAQAELPERLVTCARPFLQDLDTSLVREAATASGRLGDLGAIPELVELLEHPSKPVAESAHWSLKRLTGLSFRADARRWQSWLVLEQRWWDEVFPGVENGLASDDHGEVFAALSKALTHRLYRDEVARAILPLLGDADPALVGYACMALGQLGSPLARVELEGLIESTTPEISTAASSALAVLDRTNPTSTGQRSGSPHGRSM
jgi:HEAT repeat protein